MKNKLVPKIRFKEFSEEWEEKVLGKIGKTYSGLTGKTKEDFGYGDAGYITYMNVFSDPIIDKLNTDRIGIDYTQNHVEYGDIFFTVSSETPEEVGMSSVWLNYDKNIYLNSFCFGYRLNKKVDSYYMTYFLRSPLPRKKISILAQGISRYNISKNRVMEIGLLFPSFEEQIQIGNYFQKLDILINKTQTKLDKLKNIKQACLEKMFPKKGETIPEIRFKGFSGEWEEKVFKDNIVSIQTGTNLLGNVTNTGIPLLKMGNIQRSFFSFNKVEYIEEKAIIEKENIAHYGDFFFNTRNTLELVGKGATWMGKSGKYAFNSNIARFVFKGINTIFFNYLYNTELITSQVYARAMGTTSVAAIYPENLNSIEYRLPTPNEQQTIGLFFKNLDNLILKNEQQLTKLRNIKKACLEKMFVNKEDTI